MSLWLARHAQPVVAPGVCYGATDIAADAQATLMAAQALAASVPHGLRVMRSPLQRCGQLAQSLHTLRPDLSYITDARLSEMDFGCWEGQPWNAIPEADYALWTSNFAEHRFGGRMNVREFMQRVASVWDDTQSQPGQTLWITHAGVIRAASLLSQGVREVFDAAQWPQAAPALGGWTTLPI